MYGLEQVLVNYTGSIMSETHSVRCKLAADVLRSGGTLTLPVAGRSMFPSVRAGDELVVERTGISKVSHGDIVLFARGERLCAHRVVSNSGTGLLTRGDATQSLDAPIDANELLGKVSFVVRDGKCIVPNQSLGVAERLISELMRRSELAARVISGMYGLLQAVAISGSAN